MKKFILVALFLLMLITPVYAQKQIIQVSYALYPIFIDGSPLESWSNPLNYNGKTYLSVYEAFEALDCQVKCNTTSGSVEVFTPAYISDQKKNASPARSPKRCSIAWINGNWSHDFLVYQRNDGIIMLSYDKPEADRRVAEYWGGKVDASNGKLKFGNGSILTIGSNLIQIPMSNDNSTPYSEARLPCPVEVVDGKVFIPLEACMNLDRKTSLSNSQLKVFYDEYSETVFIAEFSNNQ